MPKAKQYKSFISYWDAVDELMKAQYCIDTMEAGLSADDISEAHESMWSPQELVDWYAKKYDLVKYQPNKPYRGQ